MKLALLLLLVGGLGAGGMYYYQNYYLQPAGPARPAPPQKTKKQIDDCRDACEQIALLEHLGDAMLRACRARCDGPLADRPYQPIRSITVAPADHRKTPAPAPPRAPAPDPRLAPAPAPERGPR